MKIRLQLILFLILLGLSLSEFILASVAKRSLSEYRDKYKLREDLNYTDVSKLRLDHLGSLFSNYEYVMSVNKNVIYIKVEQPKVAIKPKQIEVRRSKIKVERVK